MLAGSGSSSVSRRQFLMSGAVTLIACHGHRSDRPEDALQTMTALLAANRSKYGVPAMAAIVLGANKVFECQAVGIVRRGRSIPVRTSSPFHLGSNAKAITATMVATLVEENRLRWETTVLDVFPEWSGTLHPDYRGINLNDLFQHHAGLPPYNNATSPDMRRLPAGQSVKDVACFILQRPPAQKPGSGALYSNAGPAIAAVMAERVTGLSWEALIRDRIFTPLGIAGGFGWPNAADPLQPSGHVHTWFGPIPTPTFLIHALPPFFRPAGDVHMCLPDYARFLRAHLNGLQGRDALLKAATVRHLHTPRGVFGLGWGVGPLDGRLTSGHDGSDGTFYISAALWHERDLAIAVAANMGGDPAAKACHGVSNALARVYLNF
jgi:D-alanyl-D-alanine carboxypeptidase